MTKPEIRAKFITGAGGSPKFVKHGNNKHYYIELYIDNIPKGTYAVTYELHETYYDPIRESKSKTRNFREEITSYGNFTVYAKVRSTENTYAIQKSLERALRETYKGSDDDDISEALEDIAGN